MFRSVVPGLFGAAAAIAGGCTPAADTAADPDTSIWIAPPGTYHIGSPLAEPRSADELDRAFEDALSGADSRRAIVANAYVGVRGYDLVMLVNAACRAGVERMRLAADIPTGSKNPADGPADRRADTEIRRPCAPMEPPDTAARG